jgi:hypothetical protein
VRPVRAGIELADGCVLVSGKERQEIGQLEGRAYKHSGLSFWPDPEPDRRSRRGRVGRAGQAGPGRESWLRSTSVQGQCGPNCGCDVTRSMRMLPVPRAFCVLLRSERTRRADEGPRNQSAEQVA